MTEIEATESIAAPPEWAQLQRGLFDAMEDAVDRFVEDTSATTTSRSGRRRTTWGSTATTT